MKKATALIVLTLLALCLNAFAAGTVGRTAPPPGSVDLVWEPSPTPDVDEYRLYYGIASDTYTNVVVVPGNVTNVTIVKLVRGVSYFFAVTAKKDGLESEYSNEVIFDVPAVPGAPRALKISVKGGAVTLDFRESGKNLVYASEDFTHWNVMPTYGDSVTVPVMPGKPGKQYFWVVGPNE